MGGDCENFSGMREPENVCYTLTVNTSDKYQIALTGLCNRLKHMVAELSLEREKRNGE